LPGGRLETPLVCDRATKDSKGSRRAAFISLSAAALGAPAGPAGFSTVFFDRLADFFFAGLATGLTTGFAGAAAASLAAG